jgi:hypothetical protein
VKDTEEKVNWCIDEILRLNKLVNGLQPPKEKPWYIEPGIWLSIILTVGMLVIIYLFYLNQQGWLSKLPEWMK